MDKIAETYSNSRSVEGLSFFEERPWSPTPDSKSLDPVARLHLEFIRSEQTKTLSCIYDNQYLTEKGLDEAVAIHYMERIARRDVHNQYYRQSSEAWPGRQYSAVNPDAELPKELQVKIETGTANPFEVLEYSHLRGIPSIEVGTVTHLFNPKSAEHYNGLLNEVQSLFNPIDDGMTLYEPPKWSRRVASASPISLYSNITNQEGASPILLSMKKKGIIGQVDESVLYLRTSYILSPFIEQYDGMTSELFKEVMTPGFDLEKWRRDVNSNHEFMHALDLMESRVQLGVTDNIIDNFAILPISTTVYIHNPTIAQTLDERWEKRVQTGSELTKRLMM